MDEQRRVGSATPALRDTGPLLERIARCLAARHGRTFSRETIAGYVEDCADLLGYRARVSTYLPVLVERFADQRLRALAKASGLVTGRVPEVLFVCTENAGRSQLAAALMRARAQDAIRVLTAGSDPAVEIAPVVELLLAERGLDVGEEFPKPLTAEVVDAADVVVTLGCGDACPVRPGRRYLDWDLPDLSGLDVESARSVRDALDARIGGLAHELVDARPSAADPAR
ncbi:arsenate reductase ArsC [Streptomyces sp. NBC_00243]|uniref:arsenate reductase/protein-tyrosine-phosphatase family protein n=1 Tax=Streptomyces sp. NBC_00243 TaxID=2975688 RepID=UPI002DDC820C|nr:arsenate reductase ArsC [Streptomyces sp. NBC_00243]WRZ17825.1 arsenate reductase ArsC [Streptomyces sp. NBC_00243]